MSSGCGGGFGWVGYGYRVLNSGICLELVRMINDIDVC